MLSLDYANELIMAARDDYAEAVAFEKTRYRRSFKFSHAQYKLMTIINNCEVNIPKRDLDRFEGLIDGDLEDVREAFKLLGAYAQKGLENIRYHRKHSRRPKKRHPDFKVY